MMKRRRLAPEVRRQEILLAAERLLTKYGSDVRVEDVVREAGAAQGTFYLYFPAWDDLLETVRERIFAAFEEAHPLLPEDRAGVDWMKHVMAIAEAFVDATVQLGRLHEAIFHSDFARRRPIPADQHPVSRLSGLLRAGQRAKSFRVFEPEPMARLLFAAMHEAADAVADGDDRGKTIAALRDLLRRVLARAPQPRRPGKSARSSRKDARS